jgi:two-component system, cell cycle sensor histidine kinase and response regulator CckA
VRATGAAAGRSFRPDQFAGEATGVNEIVVIDDDGLALAACVALLRRAGYRVRAYSKARAALHDLALSPAALVITDVFMPECDGIEVVRQLAVSHPDLPVIGVSGMRGDIGDHCRRAMLQLGARHVLLKPYEPTLLLNTVRAVIGAPLEFHVAEG